MSLAVPCLLLLLDCCSVVVSLSLYSCLGVFFCFLSCFVLCTWVVDVVVLPPHWYCHPVLVLPG